MHAVFSAHCMLSSVKLGGNESRFVRFPSMKEHADYGRNIAVYQASLPYIVMHHDIIALYQCPFSWCCAPAGLVEDRRTSLVSGAECYGNNGEGLHLCTVYISKSHVSLYS